MQKWEYMYIFKTRGWQGRKKDEFYNQPSDWENAIYTSTGVTEWKGDKFINLLTKLGEDGWELVSVSPRSDFLGGLSTVYGFTSNLVGGGKTEGYSSDFAGYTSTEMWTFKRPKE